MKTFRLKVASTVERPLFEQPLITGRPLPIDEELYLQKIKSIFQRQQLTNQGPLVEELESKIASYLKVKHCVLTSSGTTGLILAIRALNIKGTLVCPSFTFIATAYAAAWAGIPIRFYDVDPLTHNLSIDQLERNLPNNLGGILGVHLWGNPCQIDALSAISQSRKVPLLFDAAHAFGCRYGRNLTGNFGDCEVFSLHATKVFSAAEGGAITTNNDQLAKKIKMLRGFESVSGVPGLNGKMSELSGAFGLCSLERLETNIRQNKKTYQWYAKHFKNIAGVRLINYPERDHNYHYILLELDLKEFKYTRAELQWLLQQENVTTRPYFTPHCAQIFKNAKLNFTAETLHETTRLSDVCLALPNGPQMSEENVERIASFFKSLQLEERRQLPDQVNQKQAI